MGLLDSVARVLNYENINDKAPDRGKDIKTSKSTDDVKSIINVNDDLFDFMTKKDISKIRYDVVNEKNTFFNTQLRTGILKNLVDKLLFKVLDDIEIKKNEDTIDFVELASGERIHTEGLEEVCFNGLINDTFNIKVNFEEDEQGNKMISFEGMYDFQVVKKDKHIDFMYEDYKERRYLDKIEFYKLEDKEPYKVVKTGYNNFFYYSYKLGRDYINAAVIEKSLVFSELDTAIQKEIKNGTMNIFMDKQFLKDYDEKREHYIPVKVPESMNYGDAQGYMFEVVSPQLRADQYQIYKDVFRSDFADLLFLDKFFTGVVQTTATEAVINNSQTVDTVNFFKRKIERILNMFLSDFLGTNEYKISIKSYVVKDVAKVHDQVVKEYNADMITLRLGLKLLGYFEDEDSEEFKKELYTNMYQNGIPFTSDETIEAQKLGILATADNEGTYEDGSIL